jgi:hypothetical protein
MQEAVEFELADGTTVAVAAHTERAGSGTVGLEEHLETAEKTLRQALSPITSAAAEVLDSFRRLPQRPHEVEVSFGVRLDGKVGGVIASTGAGAHLDVTLHWREKAEPNANPDTPR